MSSECCLDDYLPNPAGGLKAKLSATYANYRPLSFRARNPDSAALPTLVAQIARGINSNRGARARCC